MQPISKNQVKWVRSLQHKKVRDQENVFVAEGHKCIEELRGVFELLFLATPENATTLEIEQMSSLRTPQGEIAVFRKPISSPLPDPAVELILVLDGVQDPGNLGTIIRTADWFGVRHIVCSHETADCWNPKVVQATMGALARVTVHYTDLQSFINCTSTINIPIYGTLLDGRNMYQTEAISSRKNGIIIMGNEGNGITPDIRSLITHPLFIPSYPANAPTSESLNVSIATAIILAEFRRLI